MTNEVHIRSFFEQNNGIASIQYLLEKGISYYDINKLLAAYIVVRLPLEIAGMFRDWLDVHFPDRAQKVMHIINDMRGGKDYDAKFGTRMRGEGVFAQLLKQRFDSVLRGTGLSGRTRPPLTTTLFAPPQLGRQLPCRTRADRRADRRAGERGHSS